MTIDSVIGAKPYEVASDIRTRDTHCRLRYFYDSADGTQAWVPTPPQPPDLFAHVSRSAEECTEVVQFAIEHMDTITVESIPSPAAIMVPALPGDPPLSDPVEVRMIVQPNGKADPASVELITESDLGPDNRSTVRDQALDWWYRPAVYLGCSAPYPFAYTL